MIVNVENISLKNGRNEYGKRKLADANGQIGAGHGIWTNNDEFLRRQ